MIALWCTSNRALVHIQQAKGGGMPTALILILVAVGSVVFHMLSPWWWNGLGAAGPDVCHSGAAGVGVGVCGHYGV
jgi:hypothetical protein